MSQPEATYSLDRVRTLHCVDAERWLGSRASAYWCEWSHWGETPRSFSSIIGTLESANWPRLIRPGSACIDVGAHSGDTVIPMGLFCFDTERNKKGCVIAIEPNPDVYGVLSINTSLNTHVSDFHLAQIAVTAQDEEQVELADHGNANCNGGILQGGYSHDLTSTLDRSAGIRYFAKGRTLESVISEYLTDEQARNVSFVKTDLEGYDKNVIRSAKSVLEALRPNLFVEWFDLFTAEDSDDLFAAISEINYVPLDPTTLRLADRSNKISDLVCIHRSVLSSFTHP